MQNNFRQKTEFLKNTIQLASQQHPQVQHHHSSPTFNLNLSNTQTKQNLFLQHPIIIQKKSTVRPSSSSNLTVKKTNKTSSKFIKKQVESFVPVKIEQLEKRIDFNSLNILQSSQNKGSDKREIHIKIENDDNQDKELLKKLYKQIKKLTQQLTEVQKQNIYLKISLEREMGISKNCQGHDKLINKLEGQNYKYELEVELLRKLIKEKDEEIKRLSTLKPKQIIKEVVIQKPVEVIVEVPKSIPSPEKIIEIPKYIETEKIVYVDRPYEVERIVQIPMVIEKLVELPKQMPLYMDSTDEHEQLILQNQYLKQQIQKQIKIKEELKHENSQLQQAIQSQSRSLQTLQRHPYYQNRGAYAYYT